MSRSKIARVRPLDLPVPVTGASGAVLVTEAAAPQQPRPVAAAPFGLSIVSSGFDRSGPSPTGYALLTWFPGAGTPSDATYELQWSTAADFSANPRLKAVSTPPGEIPGLIPGTTYARVRAVVAGMPGAWSAAIAVSIPLVSDAPPPAPSGLTWSWSPQTGDLAVSWTTPAGEQVAGVQLRILTASGGTVLRTTGPITAGSYVWTLTQQRSDRGIPSAALPGTAFLAINAVSWAGNLSTDVTATATLAAPATPAGVTAEWDGATGVCAFRWNAQPAAAGFELTIDGISRPVADTTYAYGLALNRLDHGGVADPSLTWSLVARDALGQRSAIPASGTAIIPRPATPTGVTHAWTADDGTADEDWSIDCTPIAGVVGRRLTIDGAVRDLPVTGRYAYPYSLNRQEHSGSPSPTLIWSLVWVDALGQTSATPAGGTAINAAPPAVTISLSAGGNTTLGIVLGPSAARDLESYRVRVYKDLGLITTLRLLEPIAAYDIGNEGEGDYTADVAVLDLFGQPSSVSVSATVTLNPLTLAELRAGITFRDDLGTNRDTLKSALADDNRASGGIVYS